MGAWVNAQRTIPGDARYLRVGYLFINCAAASVSASGGESGASRGTMASGAAFNPRPSVSKFSFRRGMAASTVLAIQPAKAVPWDSMASFDSSA
jgi:hypothetical protein